MADLGSSRDKLDKALAAQEKAWADCLDAESKDKGVASPDSDPWIAALRYQVPPDPTPYTLNPKT